MLVKCSGEIVPLSQLVLDVTDSLIEQVDAVLLIEVHLPQDLQNVASYVLALFDDLPPVVKKNDVEHHRYIVHD